MIPVIAAKLAARFPVPYVPTIAAGTQFSKVRLFDIVALRVRTCLPIASIAHFLLSTRR